MRKHSIRIFLIAILIVPLISMTIFDLVESNYKKLPTFKRTHHLQRFHFVNQDGIIKSDSNWAGKIVVANFFFTNCPVVCPKMISNIKKLHATFETDSNLLFNSFTVDPERDSVGRLNSYAHERKILFNNWDLLTGDKKEIYTLARNGFMVVATDGDGGPDDFIHSEKVVLMDQKSEIRGYYDGTSDKDIGQLIKDIKKLKHEN